MKMHKLLPCKNTEIHPTEAIFLKTIFLKAVEKHMRQNPLHQDLVRDQRMLCI